MSFNDNQYDETEAVQEGLVEEKKQKVEKAMELIEQAKELVDEAIEGLEAENHYYAYGRYGIDTALGNGNPHDGSLPKIINEILGRDEDGG